MEIKEEGDFFVLTLTKDEFSKIRTSIDYIQTFYKSLDGYELEMSEEEAEKLSYDLHAYHRERYSKKT